MKEASRRSWAPILRNLVLAAVALGLLDLQLRAVVPEAGQGFFIEHPLRFWALRPGTDGNFDGGRVRVNSLGLRGAEIPAEKEPGEVRILLLGDSCVFSDEVDQSRALDAALERELRARTGLPVRVINGGCPGYSSFQGTWLVRDVADEVDADLVVPAYFYADASRDFAPDHVRLPPPPLDRLREILWSSGLYRALRRGWLDSGDTIDLSHERLRPPTGTVARVPPDRMTENLERLVRDSGAERALFLLLPSRTPQAAKGDPHREAVARAVRETPGADLLDLQLGWPGHEDPEDLRRLFLDDIHLSGRGCAQLAKDLADRLQPWVEASGRAEGSDEDGRKGPDADNP